MNYLKINDDVSSLKSLDKISVNDTTEELSKTSSCMKINPISFDMFN